MYKKGVFTKYQPIKIPYAPFPENISKLKQYIISSWQFFYQHFQQICTISLQENILAHIHLKPDAVSYTRHSPLPLPRFWKASVN